MKIYDVRISYTHRRFGPGQGRTIQIHASSFHTAIKNAVKMFWNQTDTKDHNDIRRGGLRIDTREVGKVVKE